MTEVTTIKTSDNTSIKYSQDGITEYAAPGAGAIMGGVMLGSMANSLTSNGLNSKIVSTLARKLKSTQLTKTEESSVFTAGRKALESSGMKDKGVRVLIAGKTKITDWYPNMKDGKLKELKNFVMHMAERSVKEGENAFFSPDVNKVVIPPKGKGPVQLSVFHEIGHSVNFNASKTFKILQKFRMLPSLVLPIISLIALYKTQKASDEKATGIVDKSTDFIKNNAGKLTFATFVPMIAEEGMASVRGAKMAKSILKPDLAKKVCKFQGIAFLTYLTTALMAGLGMWAAVAIKDKIASKEIIDYNKHFDFDGDGTLSDSERTAKETYINGRKEEHDKLFKDFDINKNGKLEKEELEAMQAFLMEA